MKKTILLSFALVATLLSCQKQKEPENLEINENAVVNDPVTPDKTTDSLAVTSLACNAGYEMNISWPDGPQSRTIKVEVIKDGSSEILEMRQAQSADGAKYESSKGEFVWNKGKDWKFGRGDSTLCDCSEK